MATQTHTTTENFKKIQKTLYWKKVRVNLLRLTTMYREKQKDLRITDIEYNPKGEKCQLCDHDPINNIYILTNLQTKESKRIGSECAQNFAEEKFLLEASGMLRSHIFSDKFKDTVAKINTFKYRSKAMRTFMTTVIEKGNYPWKELNARLEKDFKCVSSFFVKRIENFTKNYPERWIAKEIKRELDAGNLPSDWQIKEMEAALIKINKQKNTIKTMKVTSKVKEVKEKKFERNLSKEEYQVLPEAEKKEYTLSRM